MDISLIEEKMEESIKHIYELNSVVRMSLIEMQFIKKELLSALVSMDELMGSNEINMQIAAMVSSVVAAGVGYQLSASLNLTNTLYQHFRHQQSW